MAIIDAIQTGAAIAGDPLGIINTRIQEAKLRRAKEDEQRKAEESALQRALTVLGEQLKGQKDLSTQEAGQARELEEFKQKGLFERTMLETGAEPLSATGGILQSAGLQPTPETETPTSVNRLPAMSLIGGGVGDVEGIPTQAPSPAQGVLQAAGVAQPQQVGERIVNIPEKGRFRIPEKPAETLTRLSIEEKRREAGKIKTEEDKKIQIVKDNTLDTLNTIKEIENGIQNFGAFGGVPSLPGTDRRKWEANVDKLLSQKIIDVLTSMKEASKTGATGFGQLSNKELEVLKNSSTALKRTLSPKDAQEILDKMKDSLTKVIQGKTGGTLMEDASGNRAIVFQDGSFEEVP